MASRYRFISCHATQRMVLDSNMRFDTPAWSWAVDGNGSLTASMAIPNNTKVIERVRAATEPLVAAIYVQKRSNGSYTWGGPVIKRSWFPGLSQLSITCMEWRSWAYNIQHQPNTNSDVLFTASPPSGEDQLSLARRVFAAGHGNGTGGGNGCPPYTTDSNLSGKARELNYYATQGKRVGELLDTMSNRDGGFEWTLEPRQDGTDGLPRLHFSTAYPERGAFQPGLTFKATPGGSNFKPDAIEVDGASAFNQFLATGSGTPPDMLFAKDMAQGLASNSTLRMDGSASYNTVVDRVTLAAHARKAIQFYAAGVQLVKGTHTFGEIDPDSYSVGDRGSVLIRDRFLELSAPAARVIEKSISLAGAGSVTFVLDMNDATLPEVDAGGMI